MYGAPGCQSGSPADRESEAEFRQHFLNFFPLPQGQGSLRPTLRKGSWGGIPKEAGRPPSTLSLRGAFGLKLAPPDISATVSPNNVRGPSPLSGSASGCSTVYCRSSSKSLKV